MYSVYYISVGSSTCFGCSANQFQLNNESGWYQIRLINTRSCIYSCTSSWWWVSTLETCRAAYRNVIKWIQWHVVGQLSNSIDDARTHVYKIRIQDFLNKKFSIQDVPGGMCQTSGVFLMLNYTDTTQNTYIQSWTVMEIMAREVWNFDSCYSLIDYQIHIETGRNMWFL